MSQTRKAKRAKSQEDDLTSTINLKGVDLAGPFDEAPGEDSAFSVRLAYTIGQETVRAFAERARVSPATIRAYLREDRREPGRDVLVAIATAGDVHIEWLATGRGPVSRHDVPLPPDACRSLIVSWGRYRQGVGAQHPMPQAIQDFVRRYNSGDEAGLHAEHVEGLPSITIELVNRIVVHQSDSARSPLRLDDLVPVPLGVDTERGRAPIAISPDFAERFLRVRSSSQHGTEGGCEGFAFVMRVEDRSMAPVLDRDDAVIVERISEQAPLADGVYVLEVGGATMIRRITRRIGKGLRVAQDANQNDYWEGEEEELRRNGRILGKVVSVVKAV